jgi:transposase
MQIKSIGIDLGKTTFHLIAPGDCSQVVIRKKFSRSQLLVYTANLRASLIGMEAGMGYVVFLTRGKTDRKRDISHQ